MYGCVLHLYLIYVQSALTGEFVVAVVVVVVFVLLLLLFHSFKIRQHWSLYVLLIFLFISAVTLVTYY